MQSDKPFADHVSYHATSAPSIQAPWSKSQDETVLQQLQGGVRFLDLRVQALGKNNFAIVHSMVSVPVKDVLDDIVTFCNDPASSQEIVLLSITKKYKMDGHEDELADLIKTKLGSLLIDRMDPSTVTLNSLWTKPGRVIVFYPDAETVEKYPYLWLKNKDDCNNVETQTTAAHTTFVSTMVNTWPKTKDSDYLSRITRGNKGSFLTAHPNDYSKYFYVSQLVRTQDGEAIAIGVVGCNVMRSRDVRSARLTRPILL